MDGVILDSETVCWRTWDQAAIELNLANIETAKNRCMGTNHLDSCQILRDLYGKDFDSEGFLKKTYDLFYKIEDNEGIPLMKDVKEVLDYLSKKYIVCLASSTKKEAVTRQLTNTGVIDYFKTLTTGDMVSHSKPDPEIYLKAAESIGIKPENCVAIEDSPNGIRSAFAAGIQPVMVPDKISPDEEMQKKCWKILSSLKEITSIL